MIYCENIVYVTTFFLLIHRFHNFFFTFSAIPLPQLIFHKFFELIIINHVWFIVKILCTWQPFFFSFTDFIIFFFPFSAMALPQLPKQFFFSLFRQWRCRNCFFFFNWTGSILGRGISVTVLPKFFCFLSPHFCWISATLLPKFFLSPQFAN